MFTELLPLLADRILILTIARIDDNLIRVNVVPKSSKGNDNAEKTLTTPLSMTGGAADLDRDLSAQLTGFVSSIQQTGSNLARIEEIHRAALKAVEAENKKTLDTKRKTVGPKAQTQTEVPAGVADPVFNEGKPVFGGKPSMTESASLFDAAPDQEGGKPADASATNGSSAD